MHDKKIIVVGGGVAGVCCVEELDSLLSDGQVPSTSDIDTDANSHVWKIVFITGSRGFIKIVTDTEKVSFLWFCSEKFGTIFSDIYLHF